MSKSHDYKQMTFKFAGEESSTSVKLKTPDVEYLENLVKNKRFPSMSEGIRFGIKLLRWYMRNVEDYDGNGEKSNE